MIFDCMGRKVPGRVEESLVYRERLSGLCFRLNNVVSEITHLLHNSYGESVDRAVIERAALVMTSGIMDNVPGYACPAKEDKKHPPVCRVCEGRQWLTPNQYEMASRRDPASISPES